MTAISQMVDKPISPELRDFYYNAVKDMATEDFTRRATEIARTRKYTSLPTPADFLNLPSDDEDGMLAAKLVLKKMRQVGADTSPWFDDEAIHRAIDASGGWLRVCEEVNSYELDKLGIWEARFKGLYGVQKAKRGRPRLVGWLESQNTLEGYFSPSTGLLRNGRGEEMIPSFIERAQEQFPKRPKPKGIGP